MLCWGVSLAYPKKRPLSLIRALDGQTRPSQILPARQKCPWLVKRPAPRTRHGTCQGAPPTMPYKLEHEEDVVAARTNFWTSSERRAFPTVLGFWVVWRLRSKTVATWSLGFSVDSSHQSHCRLVGSTLWLWKDVGRVPDAANEIDPKRVPASSSFCEVT